MLDPDSEQRFVELTKRVKAQTIAFFIGAGMSIPSGKKSWRHFLLSNAPGDEVRATIEQLLSGDRFEQAATVLVDALSEEAFNEAVRRDYGSLDLDEELPLGPVKIVPKLAKLSGTAIIATTNFDRVLEAAWIRAGLPPQQAIYGGDPDRLRDLHETRTGALWKLHGEFVSRTHRVLTRDEYCKAYGGADEGAIDFTLSLPSSLSFFFACSSVLFLGCSLATDRTMTVLANLPAGLRASHYAILEDSNPSERANRDRWLLERSIHAIWYPRDDHRRVDELLRRLYREVTGLRSVDFRPTWSDSTVGMDDQSWLERDKLCEKDFSTKAAIQPPQLKSIMEAIVSDAGRPSGKHIVISGDSGSGKSAFAAWIEYELNEAGVATFVWAGEKGHSATFCERVRDLPRGYVGIIDDAHLVAEDVANLLDDRRVSSHSLVIIGRPRVFEEGALGPRVKSLERVSLDANTKSIAREMVPADCPPAEAEEFVNASCGDLVLMKMLLLVRAAGGNAELSLDSVMRYMKQRILGLRHRGGTEMLRLYFVLACLRVMELPCSRAALSKVFGFEREVIRKIVEREQLATLSNEHVLLTEHARRAELYLLALNDYEAVDGDLRDLTLDSVDAEAVLKETRFWSLTLAIVLGRIEEFGKGPRAGQGKLKSTDIVDRLINGALSRSVKRPFGQLATDWSGVAAIASQLEILGDDRATLTDETEERRLELVCAIANGMRRHGGAAAASDVVNDLQQRLGVAAIPERSFENKGTLLYQLAYVTWMRNDIPSAMRAFELSETAAEKYAEEIAADAGRSVSFRAKAVMSRIVWIRMQVETRVMHELAGTAAPVECILPVEAAKRFSDCIERFRSLQSTISTGGRKELLRFLQSAYLHLGQTYGWMGEREPARRAAEEAMNIAKELGTNPDSPLRLLRGLLAYAEGNYEEALREIAKTPVDMMKSKSGETSGLRALCAARAAQNVNDGKLHEYWRRWLSEECPRESGNAPAVDWASAGHR